jgi:hypothetical protein
MQHQHTNPFSSRQSDIKTREVRIDFSFRREVFFIIAGALVRGLAMMIPLTFFQSVLIQDILHGKSYNLKQESPIL